MNLTPNIDFIKQWEQEFLPPIEVAGDKFIPVMCADCLKDEGLKLEAEQLAIEVEMECPNCSSTKGPKLSVARAKHLLYRYFTSGSVIRQEYGGFPLYASNGYRPSELKLPQWLTDDLQLLSDKTSWGVIHYGPRAWMYGEITPLKLMLHSETQVPVFKRILNEYPTRIFTAADKFYRMRLNITSPSLETNYDSPPFGISGAGRLDSSDFPVLYGSQDLEVCVHECRTTADDDIYVATLAASSALRLLDLSALLSEDFSVTEFESLDMAVHMLFLARDHSYPVSRALARFLQEQGFDGVLYPSYFSLLRTGARLFETVYGMSIRRIDQARSYAASHSVPNIGIFGRPLFDGRVSLRCIDKVRLEQARYKLNFGPVEPAS